MCMCISAGRVAGQRLELQLPLVPFPTVRQASAAAQLDAPLAMPGLYLDTGAEQWGNRHHNSRYEHCLFCARAPPKLLVQRLLSPLSSRCRHYLIIAHFPFPVLVSDPHLWDDEDTKT